MALGAEMRVEGVDKLYEKLRSLTPKRSGMVTALKTAAEVIRDEAQERVNKRTSLLKGKIKVTSPRMTQHGASVKVVVPRGEGVGYGIPLEYGHVNRDGSFTRPYPYMSTAYESKKSEAYRVLGEGVMAAIREVGGEA